MRRDRVERARSGDREAFAELAAEAMDRLYRLASLILRDADRAEDAVQEALVGAWRDLRGLRDPDAWDAWVTRLTVRSCYRLARHERRRSVVELRDPAASLAGTVADPAPAIAERDRLDRELGRLPLDQRAVLVLHFHLDLTLPRVAEVLGIPVGTAKSRLHYGLQALRRSMEQERTAEAAPMRGAEVTA